MVSVLVILSLSTSLLSELVQVYQSPILSDSDRSVAVYPVLPAPQEHNFGIPPLPRFRHGPSKIIKESRPHNPPRWEGECQRHTSSNTIKDSKPDPLSLGRGMPAPLRYGRNVLSSHRGGLGCECLGRQVSCSCGLNKYIGNQATHVLVQQKTKSACSNQQQSCRLNQAQPRTTSQCMLAKKYRNNR